MFVTPPEVPETEIVYWPAAVPAGAPDVPPPLQATMANIRHTANPNAAANGRRRIRTAVRSIKTAANNASQVAPGRCRKRKGSILIPELGGAIARNAVVTVRVASCVGSTVGTTDEGETTQLIVAGAPQLRITGCEKPLEEVTLIE